MDLPKIHSITKKIFVALVGGFLLVFLLFHMTANLLILRHDGGEWYSAFCHFMGSNLLVKIAEIGLLGVIALHILLTVWLAITNRLARPTRYHQRSKSKTHPGSKLMMWTGILIFACICIHFYDFYMVKVGVVKGEYMVTMENMSKALEKQPPNATFDEEFLGFLDKIEESGQLKNGLVSLLLGSDVIHHLSYEDKETLERLLPGCDPEPDFYYMAREKFSHWHIVLGYLFFFFVIFMHLRHAFPSAFQTLGLNNYKYNPIIEALGKIYTWIIVLGFAVVPILVFFGL